MRDDLCGVYAIANLNDTTTYISSTARSFKERWGHHRTALRRKDHPNCHLQRAWNRDGEHSFAFTILEIVDDPDSVLAREQCWLDAYCVVGSVYNFSTMVDYPRRGFKHTEESKQRLREMNLGRRHTEETKQKIAKSHEKPYPSFLNVHTGETIPPGIGLTRLCQERGLNTSAMLAVKNGEQRSCQGWILSSNADLIESMRSFYCRGEYPAFVNVHTGAKINSGKGIASMCREYGLCHGDMQAVKSGRQKSHRGWVLANQPKHADDVKGWRKHPAFINRDTGEVIPAGHNLAKACREHGLKRNGMYMVANGSNQANYGWELLKSVC